MARGRQRLQHNKWVYLYYSPPTVEDVKLADGSIDTQTTPLNDPATPQNEQNAPNFAASLSAWDPYVGYFQLSRFKFVDASASEPAHLDLDSEQQILRVPNNRGACCHVAGDIDFDSHNNLWLVTGDDTPAGGGNSGGFGPFNDQLTNESQTVAVTGATGGTFTLTFDGQTTAPIPFPLDNARDRVGARGALQPRRRRRDRRPATANRRSTSAATSADQNVPLMTADGSGLTGTTPTVTSRWRWQQRPGYQHPARGGLFNAPFVDARRTAQNTNDLRGKVLRITVKADDISAAEENDARRRVHGPRRQPLSRSARTRPGPRSTRWASGTRSGSRSTRTTSRTSATTRPTRRSPRAVPRAGGHGPVRDRARAGELRLAALLQDGPRLLQVGLQHVHAAAQRRRPRAERVRQPDARPTEHVALGRDGGPAVEPGLESGATDHATRRSGTRTATTTRRRPLRHAVLR